MTGGYFWTSCHPLFSHAVLLFSFLCSPWSSYWSVYASHIVWLWPFLFLFSHTGTVWETEQLYAGSLPKFLLSCFSPRRRDSVFAYDSFCQRGNNIVTCESLMWTSHPNFGPVPFTTSRFFVCQTLIFLHFLSSVCSSQSRLSVLPHWRTHFSILLPLLCYLL